MGKTTKQQVIKFRRWTGCNYDSLYHFKAGFSDERESFATIKTIVDREKYDRLVQDVAQSKGVSKLELVVRLFFLLIGRNNLLV